MESGPVCGRVVRSVQTPAPGQLSRLAFHVTFHGCGFLAFAFLSRFFVILSPPQLSEDSGLLAGALETPQRRVEVFTLSDPYTRHRVLT